MTRGQCGWLHLHCLGLDPSTLCRLSPALTLTLAVSRANSRSEVRAEAVGVGSSAGLGAASVGDSGLLSQADCLTGEP